VTDTLAIADRIDQIIGWAKAGKSGAFYLMDRENVDTMRDDILRVVASATSDPLTGLRAEIRRLRTSADDHANDLADEGKDAERAFGRVEAYDAVLKLMAHLEEDGR
jgi:hypothetical protein